MNKIKSQKVFESDSKVSRSYRGKIGRGSFLYHHILNRVKNTVKLQVLAPKVFVSQLYFFYFVLFCFLSLAKVGRFLHQNIKHKLKKVIAVKNK